MPGTIWIDDDVIQGQTFSYHPVDQLQANQLSYANLKELSPGVFMAKWYSSP